MCVWNTLTIMKGPSGCSVITRIASRAAVTALLCCSVMTDLLVELTKSSLYNMLGLLQSSNGITFLRGKRRYRKVFNHEHSLSDLLMVVAMGFRGRAHHYGCASTKCVTFGLMLVFIYLQLAIVMTFCVARHSCFVAKNQQMCKSIGYFILFILFLFIISVKVLNIYSCAVFFFIKYTVQKYIIYFYVL